MGDNDTKLTYTENKDGTLSIRDSEGKDVRYAKESDLLAVKGSAEALERQAAESQKAHQAEITTATTDLATARQEVLQAEAKVTGLEEKVAVHTGTAEELAQVKQDLEAAKKSGVELTDEALEYRRTLIVATYGIPADTVKEKTMEQLDHYEEAIKAVLATRGAGNYAIGGGGGGAEALKGISPMSLARMAYEQGGKSK